MTDGDQRNRAKFLTDQFTADLLNNAGLIGMRGRYVHVYLNGLYWGLYDMHERMDEAAASSYMGGRKEEWDILKHRGNATGLQNGTVTNYTAMMVVARGLTNAPVGSNAVYEQLQNFLDVPWFIDYMAVNFWQGNTRTGIAGAAAASVHPCAGASSPGTPSTRSASGTSTSSPTPISTPLIPRANSSAT
jgi:hypothetical protein